jgi:hypothetical protein
MYYVKITPGTERNAITFADDGRVRVNKVRPLLDDVDILVGLLAEEISE